MNKDEAAVLRIIEWRTTPSGRISVDADIKDVCLRLIGVRAYESLCETSKKKAADKYEKAYGVRP